MMAIPGGEGRCLLFGSLFRGHCQRVEDRLGSAGAGVDSCVFVACADRYSQSAKCLLFSLFEIELKRERETSFAVQWLGKVENGRLRSVGGRVRNGPAAGFVVVN